MKVAVTAASGGLGQAILKYLSEEIGAENVIAVARSPDRVSTPGIEVRRGDYQSVAELTEAFSAIDTVVMISAPVGDWDRIIMHRNVIEAAKQAGVCKLLYTSVVGNGKERRHLVLAGPTDQSAGGNRSAVNPGWNGSWPEMACILKKTYAHIVNAKGIGDVPTTSPLRASAGYITVDELAYATAKLAINDRSNGQDIQPGRRKPYPGSTGRTGEPGLST